MAEAVRREVVEALARNVVAEVSPAEMPLFRATAARYFEDPDGTLSARRASNEALGFGAETAVVLVGPFALDLAKRVLTRLFERLGDTAADGLAARLLQRLKPDRPETSGLDPLDPGQLALVRETADEQARRLALPPDQASRLADAVVASLATRA